MDRLDDLFTDQDNTSTSSSPSSDRKELPTAAEVTRLPPDVRSKIAKQNSAKGGDYERTIGKKISAYHEMDWKASFLRTKRTAGGQPHGDLKPIDDMYMIWKTAGLGPIECKNRREWAFGQLFKNPEKNKLIEYWLKSNADTNSKNSLVFFTKPGVPDFVLHLDDGTYRPAPVLKFHSQGQDFIIETLKSFLEVTWSK